MPLMDEEKPSPSQLSPVAIGDISRHLLGVAHSTQEGDQDLPVARIYRQPTLQHLA